MWSSALEALLRFRLGARSGADGTRVMFVADELSDAVEAEENDLNGGWKLSISVAGRRRLRNARENQVLERVSIGVAEELQVAIPVLSWLWWKRQRSVF